jgi:hypothetical protein
MESDITQWGGEESSAQIHEQQPDEKCLEGLWQMI